MWNWISNLHKIIVIENRLESFEIDFDKVEFWWSNISLNNNYQVLLMN